MKRQKIVVFVIATILGGISFSMPTFADNEANPGENSSYKFENIAMDCDSIKQTEKRIQNIDKNARVSMGRSYQSILTNFITPLNVRIIKNNQKNVELTDIQSDFVSARETFNANYISYSQDFEELLKLDCKAEPESFYAQLVKTREKRAEVAAAAKKVRLVIDSHIEAVKNFKETLEVKNEE